MVAEYILKDSMELKGFKATRVYALLSEFIKDGDRETRLFKVINDKGKPVLFTNQEFYSYFKLKK